MGGVHICGKPARLVSLPLDVGTVPVQRFLIMISAMQQKLRLWHFFIKMLIVEKNERKRGKVSSQETGVCF